MDIETASELTGESRTKLAQAKSRGLVRTLISEALTAQKNWEEIKDSLHLKISNADIHTSISHFMDIQQTDKESLATYVHRFKWEASRCKFNNDTTTIRIFLKGLKNAHTIATKLYEKGPQTFTEAIKEVEKLQATQQITSTLLPASLVNTMSSDNDRCFQCQEIGHMACFAPTDGATTVIIMDMLPWTAWIRYHHLAHQHAAGLTAMTGMIDPPLDDIASPDVHTMITRIDPGSVAPNLAPITIDIRVVATKTPTEVTPDHSTDLPTVVSHVTGAQFPTTTATTCCTADLLLIGILPEMTADLNINPKNNTTDWPTDPHPPHKHHLGNIRIRDTSKSPLMTHHQNTTAQMIMTMTQRMIKLDVPSPTAHSWRGLPKEDIITIAHIMDCPTVTVHAGKCYQALIDSGAAISLIRHSTYKQIEDCYKTPIQPTAAKLNTTDGSPMTTLGSTALHL